MKWKLVMADGTQLRFSGWAKVLAFVAEHPELSGRAWEKVSKRPRSQRRAAVHGLVVDGYTWYCSFAGGRMG